MSTRRGRSRSSGPTRGRSRSPISPAPETLSVPELRKVLSAKGLPSTGRRDQLLARLQHSSPGGTAKSSHVPDAVADSDPDRNRPVTHNEVKSLITDAVATAVNQAVAALTSARTASDSSPSLLKPASTASGAMSTASARATASASVPAALPAVPSATSASQLTSASVPVAPTAVASAASALPSANQPVVPARLRERILRGEFLDLSELLPEAMGTDSDIMQLDVGAGRTVQLVSKPLNRPQSTKRHIHDISTWLEAFTTYARVIVDSAPEKAVELLAYQATIIDANCHYHSDAWLTYDRKFRLALATMPHLYSWQRIDTNLWQSCLTSRGRPPCTRCSIVHPVGPVQCPFRGGLPATTANSGSQFSIQPRFNGRIICRNYNNGLCSNTSCPRAHVCLSCRGKHTSQHCSKSGSSAGNSK